MAGPLLRLDDVGLAYHSRRGIQAVLQHIYSASPREST